MHNRKLWNHIHVRAYKLTCKDQLEIGWLKKKYIGWVNLKKKKKEMVSAESGVSCRRVKRIFMTGWAKSMPVALCHVPICIIPNPPHNPSWVVSPPTSIE